MCVSANKSDPILSSLKPNSAVTIASISSCVKLKFGIRALSSYASSLP